MKPTYAQIGLVFKWFSWRMPSDLATDAVNWLEKNATRKDVSKEISRLHDLYYSKKLTKELCFDSPIWNDYKTKITEDDL